MKLKVKVKQPSKPNTIRYSTKHWGIYIVNRCLDEGYQISNLKLQYLLYFVYKYFKDKNMQIFYNDVKGLDWTYEQGFLKFFSAYNYINGLGITKFSSKIDEELDLTNCVFRKEVDDIIKCYAEKDVFVLDMMFKKAEAIKEIEEITEKTN